MIAIVRENYVSTFDVLEGLPSLIEATRAIRKEMGWDLAECITAARMLLEMKSIDLAHCEEV